ncbi:hypothetical protein C8F01DRAFT_218003 [Mycena amicta]|nr:hypothetical protein C8F01DRAFT_218003 [Mycena amicta]
MSHTPMKLQLELPTAIAHRDPGPTNKPDVFVFVPLLGDLLLCFVVSAHLVIAAPAPSAHHLPRPPHAQDHLRVQCRCARSRACVESVFLPWRIGMRKRKRNRARVALGGNWQRLRGACGDDYDGVISPAGSEVDLSTSTSHMQSIPTGKEVFEWGLVAR